MIKKLAIILAAVILSGMLGINASAELSDEAVGLKFSDLATVFVRATDDEGNVYYEGYKRQGSAGYFFKADKDNNIRASYALPANAASLKAKVTDESVYLLYAELNGIRSTGVKCTVLDKNLKNTASYDFSSLVKDPSLIDVTDGRVCYAVDSKLYLTDFSAKGKILLMDLNNEKPNNFQGIALTGDYAAFYAKGMGEPVRTGSTTYGTSVNYYGTVELKTGKTNIEQKDDVSFPRAYGDKIIWRNMPGLNALGNRQVPATEEIVTFADGKFSKTKTKTNYGNQFIYESFDAVIDSEGRIVTCLKNPDTNSATIRVYENGSCVKEFSKTLPAAGNAGAWSTT
ncbi:MAG: hypothetical protein FWG90_05270 [Oscillospiraceae bacterium]|nr:hypothetical protein [Oscillospiraceae bacterium]